MSGGRKHSVRVQILGEEYSIRSEVPPEQTRAVAAHYDGLVRRLLSGGAAVETHRAAILAALQVTSELLEAHAAAASLAADMARLSDDVRRMLPPAKRRDGAAAADD